MTKILVDSELLLSWHEDIKEEAEYQMENYQEPNMKMVRVEAELRAALDAPQQAEHPGCDHCNHPMLSAAPKAPTTDDRKDAEVCTCRFEEAPCYICGYNGPGYYQPAQHKCAEKYHAAIAAQKGERNGL